VGLSPFRLTTGAFSKVAQLRLEDAQVALRQRREAAKAEALRKADEARLAELR